MLCWQAIWHPASGVVFYKFTQAARSPAQHYNNPSPARLGSSQSFWRALSLP